MNANELADEFKEENNDWNEDNLRHWGKQAATMLRQQQAEIEALKDALRIKVILNEHAQQSMKEVKSLLRKAQEK